MKKISFLFVFILSFYLMLTGCSSSHKKSSYNRKADEKKLEKAICEDLRSITQTSLNTVSMGMGSIVMNTLMSESEQDSLLMKPIKPILKEEFAALKDQELKKIVKEKSARYTFIAKTMLKHKDPLVNGIKKTCSFAAPLVEAAIEQSGKLAEQMKKQKETTE